MISHTRTTPTAHNDLNTITNDPGNLHTMSNHTQNDTQGAHTNRHTIANDPGNLHAMSNNTPPQGAPLPWLGCASAYPPVKSRLLLDTGQLPSAAVAFSWAWFVQNYNSL